MLNGVSISLCANQIAAAGKRQHDPATGYEDRYLGLGVEG